MKIRILIACWCLAAAPLGAQDAPAPSIDKIVLKDGSVVLGQIQSMVGGTLGVKTVFGGQVGIKWSEVKSVESTGKHNFVFADKSAVVGSAAPGDGGKLIVSSASEGVDGSHTVSIDKVTAINPPDIPAVTYRGSVNLGVNITDGNTQTKSGSLSADFEARSERQRLTAGAAYNYAEQNGVLSSRSSKGRMKYDFFVTERFFVYAGVFLEEDKFQDLNLRTAISSGPGYQFIKPGDCEAEIFKKLDAYGEIGLAFFDEDFRRGMDRRYLSARWAFVLNWPINERVTIFHRHEGYPGLERGDDVYVTTEQGVRFQIWQNFVATVQLNWRWDNTPSPGFERADTQYLATLGYAFDL